MSRANEIIKEYGSRELLKPIMSLQSYVKHYWLNIHIKRYKH